MNTLKSIARTSISTTHSEAHLGFGLLFLRVFGALALLRAHGWPKLMHIQDTLMHISDPLGLGQAFSTYYAIFANVLCAIFVSIGLLTRWASFAIISITLSGLFFIHISDPAKVQDVPLIYSIVFTSLMILGPGKYSLDAILNKKRNK